VGAADLSLESCVASNNVIGLRAESTFSAAITRVSNCVVSDNGTGVSMGTNGSIPSRGNNTVEANFMDGTFDDVRGEVARTALPNRRAVRT
jgi:hypothetical protein